MNVKAWGEYSRIRDEAMQSDSQAHPETTYYAERQASMDLGAQPAWPARYLADKGEISATQHAMNLKFDNERTFMAEYQNEPLPASGEAEDSPLTIEGVQEKINGRGRGEVPGTCSDLTLFIDVHDSLLYYMVVAWQRDFTGFILDYGTHPDQHRHRFSRRDARIGLDRVHQGMGKEAAILAGLDMMLTEYMGREWVRDDGAVLQVSRCFIDSGWEANIVYAAIRKNNRLATVSPSKGVGVGPAAKPFSQYVKKVGERYGHYWRIPSTRGTRELPTVNIDTNYWKTFVRVVIGEQNGPTSGG